MVLPPSRDAEGNADLMKPIIQVRPLLPTDNRLAFQQMNTLKTPIPIQKSKIKDEDAVNFMSRQCLFRSLSALFRQYHQL